MKLKKFRIKNYKSIVDSGDCYLTDTITILAGKNESGKTSILEALEDFGVSKSIRETARPIKKPDSNPEISVTFSLSKEDIEKILREVLRESIPQDGIKDIEVEIIKKFPNIYVLGKNLFDEEVFNEKNIEKIKEEIKAKWDEIKVLREKLPIIGGTLFNFEFSNLENEKALLSNFKNDTNINLEKIEENARLKLPELIAHIESSIRDLEILINAKANFIDTLKNNIPNFILFNSFDDVFPNKIPFEELEKNEWIRDLSIISDLNIETIKNSIDREKKKHKTDVNINLNKDYARFWTQDVSNLSIDWDSNTLSFWIEEDGFPYEPSLRSKGRQWHLAFYIKVSARATENIPNIILIDEPGLFLHAKAQEDILSKLESSSKEVQVIFSTHSPYLLQADKLDRIRLIYRKNSEGGTEIENKVHALADKETLTPILTAIGLELTSSITDINKKENIVVEGASDFYYLNAFKKIQRDNFNFIFGGGAGNMPFVGTILHGWGGKVIYLFDNDQGKKDGEKNLKDNWLITKELILSVLETAGSIEDIFSVSDFKKFILKDESKSYSESNSEYVKNNQDKVLLAKKFLEECEGIDLDTATINNIKKLFENIKNKFSASTTLKYIAQENVGLSLIN